MMKEIEMKGIKNIVFDLGGVLIDLERQRCIEAFEKIGIGKIAYYVKEGRVEDLFYQSEIGAISSSEFCQEVRKRTASEVADQDIIWAWNQLLGNISNDKKELLLKLKTQYRLFLLSNTNDMHWQHCVEEKFHYRNFQVTDYFERVFLSYEMHLLKPSTLIYEEVLNAAQLKADETLFIDDSLANCQGANKVGIRTIQETTGLDWTRIEFERV